MEIGGAKGVQRPKETKFAQWLSSQGSSCAADVLLTKLEIG